MQKLRPAEFIALMATLSAMVALSIDIMLPSLGSIATELGSKNPNHQQFIIFGFFAGLTLGTFIFGPISDAFGRKPTIFAGLVLYAIGSLICVTAKDYNMFLAGRVLQGFGAASPRIVSIAMVRDGFAGAAMAKVMSFVMSVFMIVPILAPSLGVVILEFASWRYLFSGLLVAALLAGAWLALRQPETLPMEKRTPFRFTTLMASAIEVIKNPVSFGYTLAVGSIFGAFTTYLSTSEQLFVGQYGQGKAFALWFAGLSMALVVSQVLNGRNVMKLGMRNITFYAVVASIGISAVMLLVTYIFAGQPPLWAVGVYFVATLFCCGLLFGNYNALALEPMGHIAGMASAVSGGFSSLFAISIGAFAGSQYDGTFYALAVVFLVASLVALACCEWAEAHRPVKKTTL
jgi:MFS transporter, DHA1 family, multidrug resistance protein